MFHMKHLIDVLNNILSLYSDNYYSLDKVLKMKGFLWKLLFGNYKSNYKKRYNKYKNQNKIEKNIKYMSDGEIKIKRIMNKEENQIYYTILKIFKNSYNINT